VLGVGEMLGRSSRSDCPSHVRPPALLVELHDGASAAVLHRLGESLGACCLQ